MQIGEFLVKLGTVAETAKVEQFGKSLAKVGAVATVAVGVLNTAAGAAFAFLDGQIRKAEELSKTKNGLIDITQEEIATSKEYQESTKKLSGTFDVLKAKIALGVAPQMLAITERMNTFLTSNKKLITDGLKKVVGWLFDFVDGTMSVFRSLGDLIDRTVGWKGALLILVGVLALVKKASIAAFVTNPITWVMAAIAGLILLVDDLMTYMRGGKSLFGDYWDPFIKGIRAVKKWWRELDKDSKFFFENLMYAISAVGFVLMASPIVAIITAIAAAAYLIYKNWDDLPGLFKGIWDDVVRLTKTAFKAVLEWFGLSSDQAGVTVNAIGDAFSLIIDLITYPFKQAWKLVNGLFSIWTNDSKSTIDKIGAAFSLIFDLIKQPFKKAWGFVSGLFVSLIGGGESTVEAIGEAFELAFDLITYPFKQAWELIKGLFSIWTDDSKSTIDKIGDTFKLVTDLIKQPFKLAFDWVSEKFGFLMDAINDGINKLKFWEDDVATDFSSSANMIGSAIPSVGNSTSNNSTKVIKGGDQKIDIHVSDKDAAKVISNEIQRGGNKMAQANAQLAGGF